MAERIAGIPQLTPVASPVDIYTRPAAPPQKTSLTQLAESLSDAEPQLQSYLKSKLNNYSEDQLNAARADRLKNKLDYASAVKLYNTSGGKEGIAPGQSPWYVKAYKQMDGQLTARNEYMGFLTETYQNSGIAGQVYESPEEAASAYSSFIETARSEYLKSHANSEDMEWMEGFMEERGAIEDSLAQNNLAERTRQNTERFNESTGAYITSILNSSGTDEEKAAAIYADKEKKMGQYGMSGSDYNKLTVDASTTRALNYARQGRYSEAQEQLTILDKIQTGTGTLGGISYAKEKALETSLAITRLQRTEEDYNWSKQTRDWAESDRPLQRAGLEYQETQRERSNQDWTDRENLEEITASTMAKIFANPTGDYTADFAKMLRDKNLAPLVPELQRFQDSRVSSRFKAIEDPVAVTNLRLDVMTGKAGPSDINKMVLNRELGMDTAAGLLALWNEGRNSSDRLGKVSPTVRSVINQTTQGIKSVVQGSELTSNEDKRVRAEMAGTQAQRLMLEWAIKNPEATELDALEYADKVKARLLSDKSLTGDLMFEPTPERPTFYQQQFPSRPIEQPRATDTSPRGPLEGPPSPKEIEYLNNNPDAASKFDELYGEGSSRSYLNSDVRAGEVPPPALNEEDIQGPQQPAPVPVSPPVEEPAATPPPEKRASNTQIIQPIIEDLVNSGVAPAKIKAAIADYYNDFVDKTTKPGADGHGAVIPGTAKRDGLASASELSEILKALKQPKKGTV